MKTSICIIILAFATICLVISVNLLWYSLKTLRKQVKENYGTFLGAYYYLRDRISYLEKIHDIESDEYNNHN